MKQRIDAKFFALGGVQALKTATMRLGSLVTQEPDYGTSATAVIRIGDAVKYIRITDYDDFGINNNGEFVTAEKYDDRHFLQDGDILFARSGATVGKTFIYTSNIGPSIFAGYCIRFRFDTKKILPMFVFEYTKTNRFNTWVRSIQRPSGQPNINKEEFKTFEIPVPPLAEQERLVSVMEAARAERKRKLQEAAELLNSLDSWLLDQLGITLPPEYNEQKLFAIKLKDIKGRIDSPFYNPKHTKVIEALDNSGLPYVTIGEICEPPVGGATLDEVIKSFTLIREYISYEF